MVRNNAKEYPKQLILFSVCSITKQLNEKEVQP